MRSVARTGRFSRRQRDRQDDDLPLPAMPNSNGEFVPAAGDRRDRAVNELVQRSIDESAPRLGVDRRRFLRGAGAVAASLAAFELAGCSSAATRGAQRPNGGQRPNVVLFTEGPASPFQGGSSAGNSLYSATQLKEIASYGFGSFTMGAGLFYGQAGTNDTYQPGFKWSATPNSSDPDYDLQFSYGKASSPTSASAMAHAAGLKVYLYFYLAPIGSSGQPPCGGAWNDDTTWAAWNTLMRDLGGALAWMGFDGVMLDTEVEGQNWAWTGPGGLSTQALTNSLAASRGQAWVEALNEGAGFDVPMYIYQSLPQVAYVPGTYTQYYCAHYGNVIAAAVGIQNSLWAPFVYGMAKGTTAPVINGEAIFYDWGGACGAAAPFSTSGSQSGTGADATAAWRDALNMTLNGLAEPYTYDGTTWTFPGFKNVTVNLSGTETPFPSNCYLSPMMWVADNQDNPSNTATHPTSGVWTTAQFAAALPALLEYCQYNTYSIFQGGTWVDYADNTRFGAPNYNYTPVNG